MDNADLRFENISMTGHLCYIFMCIERYLLVTYPDRDWTFFASMMWDWTKYTWETGWWEYCHRIPGIILEYKTYDDIDDPFVYNTVPREDFEKLSALYDDIEAVLKSHGIDLPDASLVSEYIKHDPLDPARQERLGIVDRSGVWGMGIDADHLSIILNNN